MELQAAPTSLEAKPVPAPERPIGMGKGLPLQISRRDPTLATPYGYALDDMQGKSTIIDEEYCPGQTC